MLKIHERLELVPELKDLDRFTACAFEGREKVVRFLLGDLDYEYASSSGLLDVFHYDPDTGQDGLMHILGGELRMSKKGMQISAGFHHEPSGELMWPGIIRGDGSVVSSTRVERVTSGGQVSARKLMEPYAGEVVINGLEKFTLRRNPNTKQPELMRAVNTMFPKEYDPLSVLQAIRIARENRDTENEVLQISGKIPPAIWTKGKAPMIDGMSQMAIKMILDFETERVVTAMPLPEESDVMDLDEAQLWKHLTYGWGS
ncbi:MAG TPA: hypothetical protein VF733_03070 [Candidatus Saccharimonadales bacterium]